jgi:hydroxyethylthiazole kinase-like uncharacterized protein yjeF
MKLTTAAQMRAIDQAAVANYGMPSLLLMENAGRAVALRVLELCGDRRPDILVLCGKGNNGGDGFVAARHLWNRGFPVTCLLAGGLEELRGDAKVNLDLALRLGVPVVSFTEDSDEPARHARAAGVIVDALLGTGFQGEPRGAIATAIRATRGVAAPVVAVDVPSGLEADTGRLAETHVRADHTVTFGLPKIGLAGYPGRSAAGTITVADISLPRPLLEQEDLAEWIDADRARQWWAPRAVDAHKGNSGRLFVLAGSAGFTGAAALTCEAALRAGAGLVTLGIPASLNPILEVKLTEAMTLPLPETERQAHCPESLETVRAWLGRVDALAVGPGFGRDPRTGELLRALLLDCPVPVVVDADGLNLLAPADESTFLPRAVITPHPAEMARLLGTETEAVQSNRLEVTKAAAARFGCVVVLKGAGTVIAEPGGRAAINSSGGPALATGGTGDLLTGMVAACLARGLEPYSAALAAVFLHGAAGEVAGERWGAPGAVAGDVAAAIPEALRRLQAGEIPHPCRTM